MPTTSTVQSFMALVEGGDYVDAIERFYDQDASMQENDDPPRVGRDVLIQGERQILGIYQSIRARRLAQPLIEGDHVAIRWQFEFISRQGTSHFLDEIAFQKWSAERIVEEKFFYDPKQLGR